MAHIPDGVLSAPVLIVGAAVAVVGTAQGLRSLQPERIPQVAVLSAAFFVASLVHFTVGPSSVHLLLTGLTGIILGWAAFPAMLVGLFLQAILFGFGGLISLGANVMNMAVPAVVCGGLFRLIAPRGPRTAVAAATILGGFGVILTALFVAFDLMLSGGSFCRPPNCWLSPTSPSQRSKPCSAGPRSACSCARGPRFWACRRTSPRRANPFRRKPMDSGRDPRQPNALLIAALWRLAFVALASLAFSVGADAHKLKAFATAEGPLVSGYAYFTPGGRAQQADVTITGPGDVEVLKTGVNTHGEFHFVAKQRVDYTITVDGGDLHIAKFTIHAADLPDSLPAPVDGKILPLDPPTEATAVVTADAAPARAAEGRRRRGRRPPRPRAWSRSIPQRCAR